MNFLRKWSIYETREVGQPSILGLEFVRSTCFYFYRMARG